METRIVQLISDGQELAEKRTWLTKGYKDLIDKINEELAKIPDMDEKSISYTLKEWDYYSEGQQANLHRIITVDLVFGGDAAIVMYIGRQTDSYSDKLEWDTLPNPSIDNIRLFARKLPETLQQFSVALAGRKTENQEAVDTIKDLLNKLQ